MCPIKYSYITGFQKAISNFERERDRAYSQGVPCVVHNMDKYGKLPAWAAVECMSLGTLSMLFGTGTVAPLLLPASSGAKKAYDKHHVFPVNFLKGGPFENLRDRRANFVSVDYQKNIYIKDEDTKVYVARFRQRHLVGTCRRCRWRSRLTSGP